MASRSTPTPSTAEAAPAPAPRPWWDPSRLAARSVFPAVLQAPALGVLLFMIAAGWGLHGVEGVAEDGPLLYTNLATFGFWVVWFMGLVLLLPLVGRVWCTVCPVGWVNDAAARWGLRRSWPRALQSYLPGGAVLLGFSLAAEAFAFNRYPDRTAYMLAVVLAAALVGGLLFRGRVFCRYLCPVGGMIGLYARLAPEGVGCRDPEVCRRCASKACFFGSERRYRLTLPGWSRTFGFRRPGCPAFVYPPEAAANAACLQCTQCFKNCPYDNLSWAGRRPLSGLWQGRTRDRSEAMLVVVLAGIVFYRLARFWGALREWVEWPATAIAAALPFVDATSFRVLKLLAGFVLWPALFLLLLAALAKLAAESSLGPEEEPKEEAPGEAPLAAAPDVDERFAEERRRWAERRRTVRGYLAAFEQAGCGELVMFPCSADPGQVDLLAEAVGL